MKKAALLLLAVATVLPGGCISDGHLNFLGYTTAPNYDCNIRTVYVPIFENRTFYRGWEFDLTKAVIRSIEAKTPFKVVHNCDQADTELIGSIINIQKTILNRNQLNEVREAEMLVTVELTWKDRRTGEVLSRPSPRAADALGHPGMVDVQAGQPGQPIVLPADGKPGDPAVPEAVHTLVGPPVAPPTIVSGYATFIPELGESVTTAQKFSLDKLALKIVQLMERPW